MLTDDLLLDSARAYSNSPNIDNGCSWYVLRVSYSRELKIQSQLQAVGVRTFVPMIWKRCPLKPGMPQSSKKLVPAISNLCFVHWTRTEIENYIRSFGEKSPVHFYWDRTTSSPLVVPEKAMDGSFRVSLCRDTTEEELDALVAVIRSDIIERFCR